MKRFQLPIVSAIMMASLFFIPATQAASGDLYTVSIWPSDDSIVHGQTVSVYVTVGNETANDLLGSVRFMNETSGEQIGTDQQISVTAKGGRDTVFVQWTANASYGTQIVSATIFPWEPAKDDTSNNTITFTVKVDYDHDGDGIGNSTDPDDDNDGINDTEDAFPFDDKEWEDSDGDEIGNNADPDDDNDGTLDIDDEMPLDPSETKDTDGDGIGNNLDTDDDNDGLSDELEPLETDPTTGKSKPVTDPENADTDGDGYLDGPGVVKDELTSGTSTPDPVIADAFPLDPNEWQDTDGDGTGDNADRDDDGDGQSDKNDTNPKNHGPIIQIKELETVDPETGQTILTLDASGSYDPDGNDQGLTFQWKTEDGNIVSESPTFEITLSENTKTSIPSLLIVIDDSGESRMQDLNQTQGIWRYLKAWPFWVGIILLIGLAITAYLKYTATASEKEAPFKPVKKTSRKG